MDEWVVIEYDVRRLDGSYLPAKAIAAHLVHADSETEAIDATAIFGGGFFAAFAMPVLVPRRVPSNV